MLQRTAWFERSFTFDLPVTMYPNVVERLRGTPARLEERVASLSPDVLTRRQGDCWSIQESVGHLLDLEPLWLGRLKDLIAGEKVLQPADLENLKTHEANHNKASITYLLTSFREMRMRLVDELDALDEEAVARTALHPRLNKPMRTLDLAFFIAEHDDHHLAWITGLRRAFSV